MRTIWPAITFSVLSAAAFVLAIFWSFSLTDVRDGRARHATENRAAVAVGVGVLLLLLAVLFWIAWLIFGPIHHAANELNRRSK